MLLAFIVILACSYIMASCSGGESFPFSEYDNFYKNYDEQFGFFVFRSERFGAPYWVRVHANSGRLWTESALSVVLLNYRVSDPSQSAADDQSVGIEQRKYDGTRDLGIAKPSGWTDVTFYYDEETDSIPFYIVYNELEINVMFNNVPDPTKEAFITEFVDYITTHDFYNRDAL
jgi:hypothetical protein